MAVITLGERCEEIVSLASNHLSGICKNFSKDKLTTFLLKRRLKWRKRNKPEDQQKDPFPLEVLCEEEKLSILRQQVMVQRDQYYQVAKRLQQQESQCFTDGFKDYSEEMGSLIDSFQSPASPEPPPTEDCPSHLKHGNILKDLEATYAQAKAFAEIKLMKHTMTPKVPKLHNRILSGNILDQSLGLLHNNTLDEISMMQEMLDPSEYSHYNVIGEEVSITQDITVVGAPEISDDNIEQMVAKLGNADAEDSTSIEMEVEHVENVKQDSEEDEEMHTDKVNPTEVALFLHDNRCVQLKFPNQQDDSLVNMTFVTPKSSLSAPSDSIVVSSDPCISLNPSESPTTTKCDTPQKHSVMSIPASALHTPVSVTRKPVSIKRRSGSTTRKALSRTRTPVSTTSTPNSTTRKSTSVIHTPQSRHPRKCLLLSTPYANKN